MLEDRRFATTIGLLLAILLAGCSKQLLGSLDEMSANQVVSTLRLEGVDADKSMSGEKIWKVTVPDDQFADAVQIIERHNLPPQHFQGLGQVFKKDSLVSTPTEERARLIYALSQELERSLLEIDGVLMARVHPVILPYDPLNPKHVSATASVLIKYRPGSDIPTREGMIRGLVAAGIEGLSYDDVRVLMVPEADTPVADGSKSLAPTHAGARTSRWGPYPSTALTAGIGAALLVALFIGLAWMRSKVRTAAAAATRLAGRWNGTERDPHKAASNALHTPKPRHREVA